MTPIYTKSGDEGYTRLFSGEKVSKSDLRLNVYGTIDELNSFLSMARAFCKQNEIDVKIKNIQKKLFFLSTDFATQKREKDFITENDVLKLESEIDNITSKIPPLKSFIYPGGSKVSSVLHVSRSVCRRAERLAVKLEEIERNFRIQIKFLNRLSDYLFVLARYSNFLEGIEDEEVNFKE